MIRDPQKLNERIADVMRSGAFCGYEWTIDKLVRRTGSSHTAVVKILRELRNAGRTEARRDWDENVVYWTWRREPPDV